MNIQYTEKKLENSAIELTVELPASRVEDEYEVVFQNIQKKAKVDGFRAGKAPLDMVKAKYAEHAEQDVIENLVNKSYKEILDEKKYTPISQASSGHNGFMRGEPFTFTIQFDVPPTVTLGDYKGLKVEESSCKVEDTDIDHEIEMLRERNAVVTAKPAGAVAENGDQIVISTKRIDNLSEGEISDTPFSDRTIIVGKGEFAGDFDSLAAGVHVGEEKEVVINYPADYRLEALRGQKATYKLKLVEVNTRTLPEIDDELAKKVGEESITMLRVSIRDYFTTMTENKTRGDAKSKLIGMVVDKSTFDIPLSLIQEETQDVFERLQQRIGYHAKDMAEFAALFGMEPDPFFEQLKDEALRNIKTNLVLVEVAEKETLTVPEEKYNASLEAHAKRSGMDIEALKKQIDESNGRGRVQSQLLIDEAIDYIYNSATVKKLKPVTVEELMKG